MASESVEASLTSAGLTSPHSGLYVSQPGLWALGNAATCRPGVTLHPRQAGEKVPDAAGGFQLLRLASPVPSRVATDRQPGQHAGSLEAVPPPTRHPGSLRGSSESQPVSTRTELAEATPPRAQLGVAALLSTLLCPAGQALGSSPPTGPSFPEPGSPRRLLTASAWGTARTPVPLEEPGNGSVAAV